MTTKSFLQIANRTYHTYRDQTGNHREHDMIARLKDKLAEKHEQIMELQGRCKRMEREIRRKDFALSSINEKLERTHYTNQPYDDEWMV
jgi:predicted RNase H-like nuclease (RuvC/YqgF family)